MDTVSMEISLMPIRKDGKFEEKKNTLALSV